MEKANVEGLRPNPTIVQFKRFLQELRPRPNSGYFYRDVFYLVAIGFIQNTIVPALSVLGITIDLMTPWIVITAIRQNALPATALAFIAALILEMRSTVPAGMYLVIYWITVNLIIQVRLALSWRHRIPWFVTYLLAAVWVHLFEVFVVFMSRGMESMTLVFTIQQIVKIVTAVAFGMFICQEWLRFDAEEPVPQ
ncbi:hypothetical protein [Pseudobacteriovorax antillogorgiicola]|uniref:Rod shape-determining protein MreD n=1 Tax=Pseudobacteriovorax antillogorgiicola TaxID=1513793 RepID=A0A1Y6BX53_9BACT|nr:hypothetical protein [Pseudobacteriovorax antillogorgiicola]TCS50191.1 hypothetical protein EDD56_1139 [Pseudobacteriovorax antillogorgiicola]SMF32153.1 hypothetical protein SAMN06296036_1108 [Pseudobacteriovorax antillogorgiicola]